MVYMSNRIHMSFLTIFSTWLFNGNSEKSDPWLTERLEKNAALLQKKRASLYQGPVVVSRLLSPGRAK
jgi:hypothetical protein